MNAYSTDVPAAASIHTPAGRIPSGQSWWNPQRGSDMPFNRYRRPAGEDEQPVNDRRWPTQRLRQAPLWCSVDLRDGNQALVEPMDVHRKQAMFTLLVSMGVKEIEVGYPSASQTDFDFVRHLIEHDLIPPDVTITVFTPARPELIERTFAALAGVPSAVIHLCNATAPLWRELVYGLDAPRVKAMALDAARQILQLSERMPGSRLRFQYSPETFNLTEPEYALDVCNSVLSVWSASPSQPVIVNLPTTVETSTPNVFADQIEWMNRHLDRRDSVILSVHPHNDRGTAVASTELALLAGAQRVEGTLFGNGERTGNVCLVTLALNLFSAGIDPQLDLSDIDGIRRTVEYCNRIPVHDRHPYVGAFVYTAFSGTHQDAIKKGLDAERSCCADQWAVPYLPIDPRDVGRTYDTVVRINSQSGKGGIAYLLQTNYGLDLPRGLRVAASQLIQSIADAEGRELSSTQLYKTFTDEFVNRPAPLRLERLIVAEPDGAGIRVEAVLSEDGRVTESAGSGGEAIDAFVAALRATGRTVRLDEWASQVITDEEGTRTLVYAEVAVDDTPVWGVGVAGAAPEAAAEAIVSAVNRAHASR
jgi:2-isopropylmalate synthase